MADGAGNGGANVRVVRCPTCQKLLPELGDVAVYRCGGCDATLQAKRPFRLSEEVSLEVTDVQRIKCVEQSNRDSKKKSVVVDIERKHGMPEALPAQFDGGDLRSVEVSHGSLVDAKDARTGTENEDNGACYSREALSSHGAAASLHGNSALVSEVGAVRKEPTVLTLDGICKESCEESSDSKFQQQSKKKARDKSPYVNGLSRTDAVEQLGAKQSVNGSHIAQRQGENDIKRNRISEFSAENIFRTPQPDEGPSNYSYTRAYQYNNYVPVARHDMDAARKVGYLEQNRAELLRMLDELRDKVQQTCKISDKPQANGPVDGMVPSSSSYAQHSHANWFTESSSAFNRNPSRRSPLYDNNMGMLNFHPNMPVHNDAPCYPDPLGHRRAAPPLPGEHPHRQVDNYLYGHLDPDSLLPYHHEGFYHQPACPCLHCHQSQLPLPACGGPTTVVGQQRVPYLVNNLDFYPADGPPSYAPRGSHTRPVNAPLHSVEQRTHGRTTLSRNNGPFCRPISGAAPFAICFNCYELLQLPEESLSSKKNQFKLRCGSCSVVISVKRVGSRLVVAAPAPGSHTLLENRSNSCNSSGNNIQSNDEKLVLPYTCNSDDHEMVEKAHASSLTESDKMLHFSSSSSPSRRIDSLESMASQKGVPSSSEIAIESQVISRVSSLPLREHFGYASSDNAIDKSGLGSRSARSDQERKISVSENLRHNPAKDAQMPIVMDVPADEYPPAGLSHDSWDMISKDEAQPKVSKVGDSFITGFIKKSFRFNQVMSHTRYKVSVNGHHIADRLTKKAEKLAGPISPGDYWYDYRAGFWGIMGHPCLGIIPPFIEEFNYPMPKKCAGGNTGILVNGRELHQKDLDLLVGRGLPTTEGCSYVLDISGKVWDESSGEELDGLGKLAPTIERLRHGFGMRSPKGIA